MKKIKSAKTTAMGRNTFGCDRMWTRNGLSVGGEQQWTSGRGDYCSDSTLETLAAAGLVAVEYEEPPRFKAGDWVVRNDGQPVTKGVWRSKSLCDDDGDDVYVLAPPEPPADVLADHCPPLCFKGEFRPPKMGEWYWSGTGGVCIYGFYSPAPMPRFILAPVEKPLQPTDDKPRYSSGDVVGWLGSFDKGVTVETLLCDMGDPIFNINAWKSKHAAQVEKPAKDDPDVVMGDV